MKPRILLSGNKNNDNYINAVTGCGGIPFASYLPEVRLDFDGLILCGGGDIAPERYGEDNKGSYSIDPERDAVELALAKAYISAGKPVLGICRGLQLLNVYFGGSLIQHLDSYREHTSGADYDLAHQVRAEEGSIAHKLYGREFTVNSSHHQAIGTLGEGLKVTMRTTDGKVIEAIEHETLPVFAVQWHPERMCFAKERPDTVNGSALIRHFIEMCNP